MSTPGRKTRMDKGAYSSLSAAFSLVESVVAGSVILFAIAVLAPSVRAARESGHVAACLANLRAIGQASLIYAGEDPNEIFIPVPDTNVLPDASGAIEWGGKAGIGQSADPNNPARSIFGTASYRGPAHRPLNPYLYPGGFVDYNPPDGRPNPGPGSINWLNDTQLDLSIYRCPADTGYAGGGFLYSAPSTRADHNERAFQDEGLTAYDHYGTSYVANVFWTVGGLWGAQLRSQSVYLTPLSRVPSPSHTLAYQEAPSRFAWIWGDWSASSCDYFDRVAGNFKPIPGWHGRDFHFNVTFADGHAAMVKMQGCVRPAPNLGLMNYPPTGCGPSVDPYPCYQCLTIRGPEWIMDTLPAQSVLTPYFADESSARSTGARPVP